MNLKPLLPALALLVLLVPSAALSRNHDSNDGGFDADAQPGILTPFSTINDKNYLNGNVNQFANGFDPNANNHDLDQQYAGNGGANPYTAGANANSYGGLANVQQHHHGGGCNSPRSQYENMLRANGYSNAVNNPNVNPYASGNVNINNPYANPYATGNVNNPYATGYNSALNNSYANANGYNGIPNNPYANPNGFNNSNANSFYNNATSASNLSRLGSVLSGSGLGNLGTYAQNGSLNGGSLSGLRGLLGI
jgi:hypothetical protein